MMSTPELSGEPGQAPLDLNTRRKKQDDLDAIVRAYREAEHMPTWPVSRPMARRFAINNALFALPLVGQVADGNGSWESLAERIVGS
jgi:hypothetical protein